ncbi:hypothetical protein ASPBRDRAFT_73202 [Aspergillus brasiliensis CBS 101740]|uniref:Uncharacterized protein n=1 Tax=Aspergillus brasiliensis (strain CBS 101740 / IMI 381727 / IBT 21946) TaxID=767769 RepID=A0A1L9UT80_ASPBC|nr:hypothetical protein ASPBRDRAFT_73202 [Aspergillus brasiliensis CBS 101740]
MAGVLSRLLPDQPLLWCRQWLVSLISGSWLISPWVWPRFIVSTALLGVHCAMKWLSVIRWLIAERSVRCHGRQTISPMVTVSPEMSDNPRLSLEIDRIGITNCDHDLLCPEESRAIDGSPNSACLSREVFNSPWTTVLLILVVHATATMGDPTRAAGPWAEGLERESVPIA